MLCLSLWLVSGLAAGQGLDRQRAHYNYLVYCRGCHLPDAEGSAGKVPRIKDYIGNFLGVEGGRDFLVRVPGAANAAIDDEQLAELLNWIIEEFAGTSLPTNFQPYTAAEVGRLRHSPLNDVTAVRAALVDEIATSPLR